MASSYNEWLRSLEDQEESEATLEKPVALLSYINGKTTANEAANECAKKINENGAVSADSFWSSFVDVVAESLEAHEKLIELLDALKQSSTVEKDAAQTTKDDSPVLIQELIDRFEGLGSASQSSHSTNKKEHQYINICAFIARFWHTYHGEWTNLALNLAFDGLEEEHKKPLTNIFGQAVAQLFLFSGPEMYAIGHQAEPSKHTTGHIFLKEREAAPVTRWDFWKRRINQLRESELLTEETEQTFAKALESMTKVEAEN